MSTDEAAEIKRLSATRKGQFPKPLRERIMAYAERRWTEGASTNTVAAELGVKRYTLSYWRAQAKPASGTKIAAVRVSMPRSERLVTVSGPCGTAIGGLTLDEAAQLLRKLG